MTDAKPLSEIREKIYADGLAVVEKRKPLTLGQIANLTRTVAPYKHAGNCFPEDWEDIAIDLLATIRRRDELIRWLVASNPHRFSRAWISDVASGVFPKASEAVRQNATEILAIVEAGDG